MSWQSRLLNLILRLTRKVLRYENQLYALRRSYQKLDQRLGSGISEVPCLTQYRCGEITVDQYQPSSLGGKDISERKVLFFLHGGAYCLRAPRIYAKLMIQFCNDLDCDGVMPDYRLAPENPHPCGINDCIEAYRHLLSSGYKPENILLFGDSAGGGLTLSVLQMALAEGLGTPAAAVLSSPAGDWTLSTPSLYENEGRDPMFRIASFLFFRAQYINGYDPSDPAVSPMLGSFQQFPPMYIVTSTTELLRDTAIEVANRARGENTHVELEVADGLCHDYLLFGFLPEAKKTRQQILDFYSQVLRSEHQEAA